MSAALCVGPPVSSPACTTAGASRDRRARKRADTATATEDHCVDPARKDELFAQRKYRLTKDRLFVKALRHELTIKSGYYVADLFEGTFTLGGDYTFFMSENFGAELGLGWSRLRSDTVDTIEAANEFDLELRRNDIIRVFGSLAWSPLYGKVKLFAASIWRYDFYVVAGPGVVVDPVSFGGAGNFGLGLRVFLHPAVALRFDVRDYLYRQELLSEKFLVNDLAFTAGVSLFIPPRN